MTAPTGASRQARLDAIYYERAAVYLARPWHPVVAWMLAHTEAKRRAAMPVRRRTKTKGDA